MEEQIQQNIAIKQAKKEYVEFVLAFLIIIITTLSLFFVWKNHSSQEANIRSQKRYPNHLNQQRDYKNSIIERIYSSKTQ